MRSPCAVLAAAVAVVVVVAAPNGARADDGSQREVWATVGMDTAFMGAKERDRGDLAYFFLMTPRVHFGLGAHASLSAGLSLPLLQLMMAGGASGSRSDKDIITAGIGVNTPIELRFTPGSRSEDGIMITTGTAPVLHTAIVCALGGQCEGKKSLALVVGYAAHVGVGYQWRNGSFLSASYAAGHLWAGKRDSGEPAIEGMYYGGWLSFGVSFGR